MLKDGSQLHDRRKLRMQDFELSDDSVEDRVYLPRTPKLNHDDDEKIDKMLMQWELRKSA